MLLLICTKFDNPVASMVLDIQTYKRIGHTAMAYTAIHFQGVVELFGHRSCGVGFLIPRKYVRGIRVCFDLIIKMSDSFIQSCKFHIIKDERRVSKMEGKTNFSMRLQAVVNRDC